MKKFLKVQLNPIVQQDDSNLSSIIISSELMKQTRTKKGHSLTLHCGNRHMKCTITEGFNDEQLIIQGSNALFEYLHLPPVPTKLQLAIDPKDSDWIVGPFIGIVTDFINNHQFGSIHTFIEELQQFASQNYLFLYVFNYINYHNHYVKGYFFNTITKEWIQADLPVPSVVHNRIHSRIKEKSDKTKKFFNSLSQDNIPYFNERFLNKWEVYETLSKHDHLLPYLPETRLLNGRISLEEMLFKHPTLFLKPVHGSQGRNIFKVNYHDNQYSLDYTTFSGEVEQYYSSILGLYETIRPRLQKQRYIAQQGLELLMYQKRPLDFRFLCHRQADNTWKITSSIARVSSQNEFVSNLARGGELLNINKVLQEQFDGIHLNQIKRLLHEIALETSSTIYQHSNGLYGEFGIDLAVDQTGKPWIIELNTKPSKNQDPDGFSPKIRPSAKAIIEYCVHLAGWQL